MLIESRKLCTFIDLLCDLNPFVLGGSKWDIFDQISGFLQATFPFKFSFMFVVTLSYQTTETCG